MNKLQFRQHLENKFEGIVTKDTQRYVSVKYKNITKENLEHDYSEAYKILEKERKKSDEFLRKALDIKDSE